MGRYSEFNCVSLRNESEIKPTFKVKIARDEEVCTLQMSGVTMKMSAQYRCQAVNSAGEALCTANVSVVGKFLCHTGDLF